MYVTDILRRRQGGKERGGRYIYIYGTVVGRGLSIQDEREGREGKESRIRCHLFHGRCLTMTIHIVHSVLDTRGEDAM